RPAECAVGRVVVADDVALEADPVVRGDVRVQRPPRVVRRVDVVRAAVVATDRVHVLRSGRMIRGRTAPARVLQRVAEAVERLPAVGRALDGVPAGPEATAGPLAERIRDLVALGSALED